MNSFPTMRFYHPEDGIMVSGDEQYQMEMAQYGGVYHGQVESGHGTLKLVVPTGFTPNMEDGWIGMLGTRKHDEKNDEIFEKDVIRYWAGGAGKMTAQTQGVGVVIYADASAAFFIVDLTSGRATPLGMLNSNQLRIVGTVYDEDFDENPNAEMYRKMGTQVKSARIHLH